MSDLAPKTLTNLAIARSSAVITAALVIAATLAATFAPALPDAFAYPLGIVLIWFLPGYFVEGILFPEREMLSLTRLPIWFVFGMLVWTVPSTALQIFGGMWFHFRLIFIALLWMLWLVSAWRRAHTPALIRDQLRGEWKFQIALLVLCAALALYMTRGPRDADDWLYLQITQQILGSNPFQLREASEARYALRYAFHVWLFTQAFFAEWLKIDLVILTREIMPPLVAALGLIAFYAWARELFRRANIALTAVVIELLIAFTNITGSGWGSGLVERAAQDKFLVWLIVVPLALLFAWQFLNAGSRGSLVAYAIVLITGLWIHPVALFLIPLSLGGFALFNSLSRAPFARVRWLALLIASLPALGAPIVIRLTTIPEVFSTGNAFVGAYIRLSEDRLWIFGNWYEINPALLSHPLILLSVFALFLSAARLFRDPRTQFLWGSALAPIALLINPLTARGLGEMLTPWQLWRLTWNVPSALILADAVAGMIERLGARTLRVRPVWILMGALGVMLAASLYQANPTRWYNNLVKDHALDATTEDMMRELRVRLTAPTNVLLPREITRYAPAYTYRAVVLSNDAQKPEDARGQEIDRFYTSQANPKFMDGFLVFWKIDYVIVPNDSHSDRFLQTYARAKFLSRNAALTLYQILR